MSEQSTEKGTKTQYDIYVERQNPEPRIYGRYAQIKKAGEHCSFTDYQRTVDELSLDPAQVKVGGGWITWSDYETDDEIRQRIRGAQEGARAHLAAIKSMHDEYARRGLYDLLTRPGKEAP